MDSGYFKVRTLAAALWIGLLSTGFFALFRYAQNPGLKAHSDEDWPAASLLSFQPESFNLLLFLHPHCPCSKATMAELERLLPHFRERVHSRVIFLQPEGKPTAWVQGELYARAGELPKVDRVIDENGQEAKRFGARTSGQTFLYDPHGRLVFDGGITPSRGHQGDSLGREAILAWISGAVPSDNRTKTFGCALAQMGAP